MEPLCRVMASFLMRTRPPSKPETPEHATNDNGPPASGGGQSERDFAWAHEAWETVEPESMKQSRAYDILVAVSVDERLPLGYSHRHDSYGARWMARLLIRRSRVLTIQNLLNKGNGHSGEEHKAPKPNPVWSQALLERYLESVGKL